MKRKIKLLLVLTMTFILALPSLSVLAETKEDVSVRNNTQVVEETQNQTVPMQAEPQGAPTQAGFQAAPMQAEPQGGNDISKIIESVEFIGDGEDRFGKGPVDAPESDSLFKIKLKYNEGILGRAIANGEKLSIELQPVDYNKSFMNMEYVTSTKTLLVDKSKTPEYKVASLDMGARDGVKLTFEGGSEEFEAFLDLPFQYKMDNVYEYFLKHPEETTTNFQYKLRINGKDVPGKVFEYIIKKPVLQDPEKYFSKTSGTYNQDGKELGEGRFLFNIRLKTELRSPNEFVIYDLPDVNLGFEGNLRIYDGHVSEFGKEIFYSSPSNKESESVDTQAGTKVKVYDVYYLTTEPANPNDIRVPEWEDRKIDFQRHGKTVAGLGEASVPKNVILEKSAGEDLTEEEQKLIDDNGGLYKKVGKGFKVRLTDYKSNYFSKGGRITLNYRMDIKNPSPRLDSQGHPVYKNYATYYAQEIPNCDENDENCTPVNWEKNKKDDSGSPAQPAEAKVIPGTIGATVTVPPVNFTKVEADSEGNPMEDKPLAGAKFDVYKLKEDLSKSGIAKNKDGVELKDLITNGDGKLTKDGQLVKLNLDTGYYQFEETSAPEGYEIVNKITNVTVGYKAVKLFVVNKKEAGYMVTYEFKSVKAGVELPEEVRQLLPIDNAEYRDGTTINPIQPEPKEVKVADGKWVFKGYDKEEDTINKANLRFTGLWDFEKNPVKPIPDKPKSEKTEDIPKPEQNKPSPKTGDNQMIFIEIAVCLLSAASIYALRKRKQNTSN